MVLALGGDGGGRSMTLLGTIISCGVKGIKSKYKLSLITFSSKAKCLSQTQVKPSPRQA